MSFQDVRVALDKLPDALGRARKRFSLRRDGVLALPMAALEVLGDISPALRMRGLRRLPPNFRAGLAGAEVATWGAVSPSLLPHSWWATALNVGVLQGIGHGFATVASQALRPVRSDEPQSLLPAPVRLAMTGVTFGVFATSMRRRVRQEELVESDEKFKVSSQLVGVTLGTLGYGVVLIVGDAIQTFIDALNELLGKKLPPVASWPLAIVGGGALLILVGDRMVVRRFLTRAGRQALELDREFMRGADQPQRPQRSGSPESAVDWNTMGRQGRAVVAGGPRKADIERLLEGEAKEPIRIFVGLDLGEEDTPDFEAMAATAIAEMRRTGAFERSHIAVMSAAGTGWINDFHTSGFEFVTRGDSAIVAMQYSYLPSAYSYMADRKNPIRSSRVLLEAILNELDRMDPDSRPKLYVGGESLGAYGVSDAFESLDHFLTRTAGGVFTGTPGFARNHSELTKRREKGSPQRLPLFDGGRHVRFTAHPAHLRHDFRGNPYRNSWEEPRFVFAQHASDPVVWWEPSLAIKPPDWLREPGSRGVPAPRAQHLDALDTMRWMPLVTYWQIGVDQLPSKDYPSPHGHNYHDETVAYWNGVIHGDGANGAALTRPELVRVARWIHNDATKTRMPKDGFPSKHGY
ncbi:alpha/beta-hydrolase family protein [Corynebacterium sp. MSK008]|uniref:alpha/beta-hydrolase family protein n=1 Tax=Corynebacterium sp. MSK008 TaxID=3050188 RepID=UPI00255032EC|nr:alpha/beta-hydrolase family protein [Corynebacterium sp. MSK008]MDK8880474.1 alpha/beta-hydrolase family protein [Corynebacterium sp. MSK008]